MSPSKTLITADIYLGGQLWRATGDAKKVNVQRKESGCVTWKTIRTVSRSEFDEYAKDVMLFDPYCRNPALIRDIGACWQDNLEDYL